MSILQKLMWDPSVNTDEDNNKWAMLRAMEWGIWPAFVSIPIVSALFPFYSWWKILGVVAVFTILWTFVRYKYVNLTLLTIGSYFARLRWIICPLSAIYLFSQHQYILSVVSLCWTIISPIFSLLVGGTKIGIIQNMIMTKLGYFNTQCE